MISRKRTIVIGVVTFLIGTVLFFPARVAYQWFVPEPVKLSGIDGSVWNGKANAGMLADVYFTNLRWTFRPLALLTGQVAFDTSVNTAAGQISMGASIGVTGNVSVTDLVASLSLAAIHPALKANRIDGTVNIQLQTLLLKNGWPTEAEGSIGVGNLVAGAMGPEPLGNFRADITTGENGIVGQVEDAGAVLELTGALQVADDRSYSLVGFVAANSATPASINQNLRFLGSPDQDGRRQFRFEGSL
jgi:general secretion pathway protein N